LADTSPILSPVVIGVCGHRNLHPEAERFISAKIDEFFADLKQRLPDSKVRIMVGMAQGADLLVARAALAVGWQVHAVLPMPLDNYMEDFDSESGAALLGLLAKPSVQCTVLRPDELSPSERSNSGDRDRLYANLSEVLIEKSHLLVALWNGEASMLPGGTADTILRYLQARAIEEHDVRALEIVAGGEPAWGPHFVYWIPTRRTDDLAMPSHAACYLSGIGEHLLAAHPAMPQSLQQQFEELNAYNREYARLSTTKAFVQMDSLMSALGPTDAHEDRHCLADIDFEYGKADTLAIHFQRRSDRLFRWFSYMAFSMALLFLVYAKLVASSVLLSLYVAILLISLCVFYLVRGRQWFSKHLVYRVLAETMRTKFFLHAAGADRLVNATELINLTGIDQFAGFSWIGNLLKNTEPLNPQPGVAVIQEQARVQSVHRHWIRGQQDYLRTRVRRLERKHRLLERTKSVLLYGIAALAIGLLVFSDRMSVQMLGAISLKTAVVFLMGLFPVWLGIWELYQTKMATRELLWQYRNQLGHFTRAELQLSRSTTPERRQSILAQVGRESLMESYLWTIHRYHREYEPPTAG
jgi:hypothetical protein